MTENVIVKKTIDRKQYNKDYYAQNREKVISKYNANKDLKKEYYVANKEKKKAYYQANKEKLRQKRLVKKETEKLAKDIIANNAVDKSESMKETCDILQTYVDMFLNKVILKESGFAIKITLAE